LTNPHHVVVVGGGIAGLEIASKLPQAGQRQPISVTLVDRELAYVWKPMLHTIAAGTSDVFQQQTNYIAQARDRRFVFQPGELMGIDRGSRDVHLGPVTSQDGRVLLPQRTIRYDTLILAVGSQANDFGTPGVGEHCHTIDSRTQAMAFNGEIRTRLLESLASKGTLTIAVVGGGATGVELAAELIQLSEIVAFYGATGFPSQVRVVLIESGPRLLAAFPERVALAARDRLEKLGISVVTHARVVASEAAGLRLQDGTLIEADMQVWAAGVKAPAVIAGIEGLETTRNGQLVVTPTLQTTRDPHVFAVGDCSSLPSSSDGRPLPPTAQVAHQQAAYLIRHLPGWLNGGELPPFRYREFGSLVSLGGYGAYGSLGQFGLFSDGFIKGRVAQLGHVMLYRSHQARLHGFWRGSLLWLADTINAYVRPRLRFE
jgi:NADH dehydrogenase